MNQTIKRQWLLDLRDGTRSQGNGYLRNQEGQQCCLDVLCEQAVRAGVISPPELADIDPYIDDSAKSYVYFTEETPEGTLRRDMHYLPVVVCRWAELVDDKGIPLTNPTVDYEGGKWSLADLNDSKYLPFEEIADVIEESL